MSKTSEPKHLKSLIQDIRSALDDWEKDVDVTVPSVSGTIAGAQKPTENADEMERIERRRQLLLELKHQLEELA